MKRITFCILIASLTFTVGITVVWLLSQKLDVREALAEASVELAAIISEPERPQFTPTGRACGRGYIQGYELPDGQVMSEGNSCFRTSRLARREWRRLITQASEIVERVPQYRNRFGVRGERILARFPPDEYGREWASIMWYAGGRCYLSINAPTIEIALEFERTSAYAY